MKPSVVIVVALLGCAGCIGKAGDRELSPGGAALLCQEQLDCDGDQVCQDGQCREPEPEDPCADVVCDDGEQCILGHCVDRGEPQCAVDNDCRPDEICLNGTCVAVPPPECVEDADCRPDEVCADGACVGVGPPECVEDSDCGPEEVCDDGGCVARPPECIEDADCGDDELCREGACTEAPAECFDDNDCGGDRICVDERCTEAPTECEVDLDCGPGWRCVDGACVVEATLLTARAVLRWETPGDLDPNDQQGADLDLHLLEMSDPVWFGANDCYAAQPGLNWDDNTSGELMQADNRAPGPERALAILPADRCRWLAIGAHYVPPQGPDFGPSTATVTISLEGIVLLEVSQTLNSGEFWDVGALHLPSATVFATDVVDRFSDYRRALLSDEARGSGLCAVPGRAQCRDDAQCDGTPCIRGLCWEVDCRVDADCAADEACRAGRCGPELECVTDNECDEGDTCVRGLCFQICRQDSDCAGVLMCSDGACGQAPECLVDVHCAPSERCRFQACLPWTQECGVDSDVDGIGDECDPCPLVPDYTFCGCHEELGCGDPLFVYLVDLSTSLDGGRFPGAEVDALMWVPDGEEPFPLQPLQYGWEWPEQLGSDVPGAERLDAYCRPRVEEPDYWTAHAVGGRQNGGWLEFIAPGIATPGTFVLHELGRDNCGDFGYRSDPMLLFAQTSLFGNVFLGIFEGGQSEIRVEAFE